MNNPILPDRREAAFGSAFAIFDEKTLGFLKTLKIDLHSILTDSNVHEEFCKTYLKWIVSSKLNDYRGIENFKYYSYSDATSQIFDKFYLKHSNKRFRIFRGEYAYHQVAWRKNDLDWLFLEDDQLKENDAVILSYPFSDTGNKHEKYEELMSKCTDLKIPVLIDCAYACIAGDMNYDFRYDCITDIAFSLSKAFPIAYARIGMRLTKEDHDDTLDMYHKINYNNRIGAVIGKAFIDTFDTDYIVNKYRTMQLEFCKQLSVEPSKTVLFGLGDDTWSRYNRGTKTNRLSFHKFFPQENIDILKYKDK